MGPDLGVAAETAGAGASVPSAVANRLNWQRMSRLQVEERGSSLRIRVRVKPRSSQSRILDVREGMLQVALAASPVDGEANAELIRALAAHFGCAKSAIEIVTGAASRSKLVAIAGLSLGELFAKLDLTGT